MAPVWCLLLDPDKKVIGQPLLLDATYMFEVMKGVKMEGWPALQDVPVTSLVVYQCITRKLLADADVIELQEYINELDFEDKAQIVRRNSGTKVGNVTLVSRETLLVQMPSAVDKGKRKADSMLSAASSKKRQKPSADLVSPADFLKFIPPPLDYVIKITTDGSTRAATPCALRRVILWDNFVDSVINTLWDSAPKYRCPVFNDYHRVARENTIHAALLYNVLCPLEILLEGEGQFDSSLPDTVGEPDFILKLSDTTRLIVEVTTKWALPASVDNLPEMYNQEVKDHQEKKRPSTSVIHPLRQIFGYLAGNLVQYGVLTTYDTTWFLSRSLSNPTVLSISPPIRIDSTQPTLLQCYGYVIHLAHNVSRLPALSSSWLSVQSNNNTNGDKQEPVRRNPWRRAREGTSMTGRSTVTTHPSHPLDGEVGNVALQFFDWGSFKVLDVLGSGRSGTVFKAILRGEMVALKICDLNQHPNYEEELINEVAVYHALKSLQGVCIPRFKGAGHDPGGLFLIATEIAGWPLKSGKTLRDKERWVIQKALSTIHDHGFVHNDIRKDNILINRSGRKFQVFFIDFAFSERGHRRGFRDEMELLAGLLGQS